MSERTRLESALERVADALETMVAMQRARVVRQETVPVQTSIPDRVAPGPVVRARAQATGTPWIERTLTPEDEEVARETLAAMRGPTSPEQR